MPAVRISIDLPYLLVLPSGEYPTPGVGGSLRLAGESFSDSTQTSDAHTEVSSVFDAPEGGDNETRERQRQAEADRFLRRVNRLLRWYRVASGQATITELTRAQASPFRFNMEGTGAPWGDGAPLEYEPASVPLPAKGSRIAFGETVRQGLGGGTDPDVATLNILDAEYAMSVGRFREAVLLCWGAIDSTFVRTFKILVDERLTDEWNDAREFLKGPDFGLRHKMTTGLRLLTGHSFHAEPENFWQELSTSYGLRNKIIHEGHIAHEDDAKLSIKVAQRIVAMTAVLTVAEKQS